MRERRTDDGTYPNVEEERLKIEERAAASAPQLPKVDMSVIHALDMLGELSDGYGPEAKHAYDILLELVTAAEEFVKDETTNNYLGSSHPEFNRLKKSLEGKPL